MSNEIVNIQITLTQILDLALGTPEVGSVNFNILHNFLHILLHKINLQDTKVEYRNDNALRIKTVLESTNENPRNYLQEYSITSDSKSQRESEKSPIPATSYGVDHRPPLKEIAEVLSDESKNEMPPAELLKVPGEARKITAALLPDVGIAPMTSDEAQYLANEVEQFLKDMTDRLTAVEIDLVNVNEDIVALQKLHSETSRFPPTKPESEFPSKVSERVQGFVHQNQKNPISTPTPLSSSTSFDVIIQSDSEQKQMSPSSSYKSGSQFSSTVSERVQGFVHQNQENPISTPTQLSSSTSFDVIIQSDSEQKQMSPSPSYKSGSQFSSTVSERVQGFVHQNQENPISTPTQLSSSTSFDVIIQSGSKQKQGTASETQKIVSSTPETPSQRISSIIQRSSLIAGVNLKELNSDVNDLKYEMSLAKQDIVDIRHQLDQLKYDRELEDDIASEKMRFSEAGEYDPVISQEHEKPQAPLSSPQSERSTPPQSRVRKRETVSNPRSRRQGELTPPVPIEDPEAADENGVPLASNVDNTAAENISDPEPSFRPSALHNVNPSWPEKRLSLPTSFLDSEKVPEVPNTNNNRSSLDSKSSERIIEAINTFSTLLSSTEEALSARIRQLEDKVIGNDGDESDIVEERGINNIQHIQHMVVKVQDIQGDISRINQGLKKLNDNSDQYKANADVLVQQIELLKTVKADKAELQDALADKADANIINRKVSNDRFETTCHDFIHGLEETISKMTQQELMLKDALNVIHQEIGTKVDRVELTTLTDFMHNRLQALQVKVKELAEKKRENEAAGTKKILSGLQCISCDTNAVMKVEQGPYCVTAMPCGRNSKPYLAYQLDPTRKQRKTPSKNATPWPAGPYDKKSKPLSDMLETYSRGHLCNRYCGGSHTTTNPQQRVLRAYHFPTDSSPEVAEQLSGGQVRGTDGNHYHGHPLPPGVVLTSKPKVCGVAGNVPCSEPSSRPPPAARERQGFNADLSIQRKSTSKSQRTSVVVPLPENSDGKQPPEAVASTAENV